MPVFNIPVSHIGGALPEDENVFYDSVQNHGWSNMDGIGLILKDQAATKVLKGQSEVHLDGKTPSAAKLIILCAVNSADTSDLAFYFGYRNVNATEDSDQGTFQETLSNQTVAGPGTALELIQKEVTLTHGNFVDEDLMQFEFGIDGANHAIVANIVVFAAWVAITAA